VKPIVSHSELSCYRACPRKHHYAYRERLAPLVPAEALTRGRGVHRHLAAHWGYETSSPAESFVLDPVDKALVLGYWQYYSPVVLPNARDVRVNVSFRVELETCVLVGECDAVYTDGANDRTVVVEHKTTSSGIEPGSSYWAEKVVSNPQVAAYLLAFPGAFVLWDALRKPAFRKLREGKTNEETDYELYARTLAAIAKEPERYYQRANVFRTPEELDEARVDIETWADRARYDSSPRNPDSCFSFGRRCEFFDLCWYGVEPDEDKSLVRKEQNHTEEVAEKVDVTHG
jgi:PD-(D/E)XK nuclease superfamily